jgi:hypothetical protein
LYPKIHTFVNDLRGAERYIMYFALKNSVARLKAKERDMEDIGLSSMSLVKRTTPPHGANHTGAYTALGSVVVEGLSFLLYQIRELPKR